MSFSRDAKLELCKIKTPRVCCMASEIYGALLFGNKFDIGGIRLVTELEQFSERMALLMRKVFGIAFDERKGRGSPKGVLAISSAEDIRTIFARYGTEPNASSALHLNAAVLEEDHCREAFIRGVFLSAGNVTDPERGYHLELVTHHYNLSGEVVALLQDMGFSPKITTRKANYVIYFKDSEQIEDFLTKCGAPSSALSLMSAKVEKDIRNNINRRVNCEAANIYKTVDAAQRQLAAIKALIAEGYLDRLSATLVDAAKLRLEHPELSLTELALSADPPVSRSGLNHRLNRLINIAEEEGLI